MLLSAEEWERGLQAESLPSDTRRNAGTGERDEPSSEVAGAVPKWWVEDEIGGEEMEDEPDAWSIQKVDEVGGYFGGDPSPG